MCVCERERVRDDSQDIIISAENDNEVKPALREKVARVKVEHVAAGSHLLLEFITHHIFVELKR